VYPVGDLYNEMKMLPRKQIQRYRVDVILEGMDESERLSLITALEDDGITSTAVAEVLGRHGHSVSTNAIRNWRRARAIDRG
jgi:IS30 family transposase